MPLLRLLVSRLRLVAVAPVALLALALGAPDALAADAAADLFDPSTVSLADIGLPQASMDALAADPNVYQPGTVTMTVRGVRYGPLAVGVRLKGHGSFQPLSGKASFKLKLNWVSGQKLLGLKKMTLNNMSQDPSRIREMLAYSLFRTAGVPSARSGYTFVTLNGQDYGLYSNVEAYDDVSLGKLFSGKVKHLYEGSYDAGYGSDVRPGHESAFEVDEGDANDSTDLSALIAGASQDGSFTENLAPFADLGEMTRMWAVENYIDHWDGYSVSAGNPMAPNNYYLHDGADGVFRMLPSGTDITFGAGRPIGTGDARLMAQCRADSACKALFDAQLAAVRDVALSTDWAGLIARTTATLAPYIERDVRSGISPDVVAYHVNVVRAFLARRPADVEHYFNPPAPAAPPVSDGGAAAPAPPTAVQPQCVVPRLAGVTLAQARKRLTKAHCSLGKVTRGKHGQARTLRVSTSIPAAGRRRPHGAKVNVMASTKKAARVKARRSRRR